MEMVPEREQALLRANAELKSALRDSEWRWRTLLERVDVGFSVCEVLRNATGEVVDVRYLELNPALEPLTGLSVSATVGRLVSDVLPGGDTALLRTFERVVDTGEPARFEAYVSALGRWYDTTTFAFGHERFAALYNDITDQKRAEAAYQASEEYLRVVIESIPDYAIFTTNLEGLIRSWNVGAQRIFGWTEAEVLDQHMRILFTSQDCALGAPEAEMQQALNTGRAADERWHVTKSGAQFYASGVLSRLRGQDARGYVKIARDLTERKRFEDELQFARDQSEQRVIERTSQLRDANTALEAEVEMRVVTEAQIKSLFRRLISVQEDERRRIARDLHDQLGQQLTALRMNIEVFRLQQPSDSPVLQQLDRTQRLADDIDRTIDYLTWQLRPEPLEHLGLAAALDQLVRNWSERFAIAGAFNETGAAQRLPSDIEVNLYRIAQEALNNVVKHARASGIRVLLEIQPTGVTLTVQDNGCGFPIPASGNNHDQLGLVSMRERADLLRGTFELESQPHGGTTVIVRVPLTL
jgi:PAS domain S-box-containing protein